MGVYTDFLNALLDKAKGKNYKYDPRINRVVDQVSNLPSKILSPIQKRTEQTLYNDNAPRLPEFKSKNNDIATKATKFVYNDILRDTLNRTSDLTLGTLMDIGENTLRTAKGMPLRDRSQQRSSATKIGRGLVEGATPQELLGETGNIATGIADLYGGGKIFKFGKKAVENTGKKTIKEIIKQSAKTSLKAGAVSGAGRGAYDSKNDELPEQLKKTAISGVLGGVTGGVLGGITPLAIKGGELGLKASFKGAKKVLDKMPELNTKGFIDFAEIAGAKGRTPKNIDTTDVGVLERINEIIRTKIPKKGELDLAEKDLYNLVDKYLTPDERNSIISKYENSKLSKGDKNDKIAKEYIDVLFNKSKDTKSDMTDVRAMYESPETKMERKMFKEMNKNAKPMEDPQISWLDGIKESLKDVNWQRGAFVPGEFMPKKKETKKIGDILKNRVTQMGENAPSEIEVRIKDIVNKYGLDEDYVKSRVEAIGLEKFYNEINTLNQDFKPSNLQNYSSKVIKQKFGNTTEYKSRFRGNKIEEPPISAYENDIPFNVKNNNVQELPKQENTVSNILNKNNFVKRITDFTRKINTPEDYQKGEQAVTGFLGDLKSRVERIMPFNEFVDNLENGTVPENLTNEANDVTNFFNGLRDVAKERLGKNANNLDNYWHRVNEEMFNTTNDNGFGDTLTNSFFDKTRTGKLTDYLKDERAMLSYWREATGNIDPTKREETKLANSILEKVKTATNKVNKNTDKLISYYSDIKTKLKPEKVVTYEPKSKPGLFNSVIRGLEDRVEQQGSTQFYDDFLAPFIYAKEQVSMGLQGIKNLPDDEFVKAYRRLYKEAQKQAVDTYMKNVKNADIKDGNLISLVDEIGNTYITKDLVRDNIGVKVLKEIRRMTGRATIGFNISSVLNNFTEIKRVASSVSTKSMKNAIQKYSIGERRSAVYGLDSLRGTAVEKDSFLRAGKAIEKADNALYYMFKKSEEFKDEITLLALEENGIKKGLQGDDLKRYVRQKFSNIAIKYGKGQDIGIYKNELSKTLLQFGQYAIKDAVLFSDKLGGAVKGDKGDLKYVIKYATLSGLQMAVFQSVLGKIGLGGQTGTPIDLARNLVSGNVGVSPVVNLLMNLGEYGMMNDEDKDKYKGKYLKNQVLRSLASTTIPASNQLLYKTIPYIQAQQRGYTETVSGNVQSPVTDDKLQMAKGLIFGAGYDPEVQKTNGNTLGKVESENYRNILEQDSRQSANEMFRSLNTNKQISKDEEVALENGTIDMVKQGVPIKDIVKQEKINLENGINIDTNILDIIKKGEEENNKYKEINEYLYPNKETAKKYDEQSRMKILNSLIKKNGWTQEDLDNASLYELKNSSVATRAEYISKQTQPDFAKLYAKGVISKDVVDELTKSGYIKDADLFWENLKMTDSFYRKKIMDEKNKKYIKDILKKRTSIANKMISTRASSNKRVSTILTNYSKRKKKRTIQKAPKIELKLPTYQSPFK